MSKKKSKEEIISIFKNVHNNKYDYSKVEYISSKHKVCIICPEHGEFYQKPYAHISGQGCPKCKGFNKTNDDFIEKAKKVHNNKYIYDKIDYINTKTKVCIICPKHGEFLQLPYAHLNGDGCPKCGVEKMSVSNSMNVNEFIEKAKKIHTEKKYQYNNVIYHNNITPVCIICPEHGEFWQRPSSHLQGCGCPKCGEKNRREKRKSDTVSFIKKANMIHKNRYSYDNVKYINAKESVCIICPEHGEFWQTPDSHIGGHGCPHCSHIVSQPESEILTILTNVYPQQRNHTILDGKEIDIYIPSLKLGIEYNGLRWHSEEFGKDHRYHLDKLNECNKQGVKLIQIFEDEWINHREICESKLKQICGLNTNPKIFGRKCEIREITKKNETYDFLDKNHIQGRTGCTVALGAYYDSKLVGVMTFKKEKEGYWDLNRFATDINYQCVGVGGKLFKYFTQHYDYQEVKSFADRRWTTDPTSNLYTKLGFEFDSFVEPTYWYYNPKVAQYKRFHKFGFRKQSLHHQYGLPLTMTEREMTTALGYTRIWDCGLIKYIYKKNGL